MGIYLENGVIKWSKKRGEVELENIDCYSIFIINREIQIR